MERAIHGCLGPNIVLPPRGPGEPDFIDSGLDSHVRKAVSMSAANAALETAHYMQNKIWQHGCEGAAAAASSKERREYCIFKSRLRRMQAGPAARQLLDIALGRR